MRNLRTLGPILAAVAAVMAIAASVAQAETPAHFEPGHVVGEGEGLQTFAITGLPTLTCVTFAGTGTLTEKSSEFETESIEFETCHTVSFGITHNVVIHMNGCDGLFTAGTWTAGSSSSDSSVHLNCPGSNVIKVTVKKLSGSETQCEIDIGSQTPTSGSVRVFNATKEEKMAGTVQVESLTFHVTQTTIAAHSALCTNHETKSAAYTGNVWVRETNEAKQYVDTTVTG